MSVWFTSDLHFGHARVIEFCKRPYRDVQEMNEALVHNWNAVVRPGDRVYVLGDLSFQRPADAKKTLARLMGQIYMVAGNHDREAMLKECASRFVWVKDYFELKVDEQKIVMSHYPFLTWNGCHRGSWHLHGHCHGSLPDEYNKYARRLDVGVDLHGYYPIEFSQVKKLLAHKEFRPVDHHGKRDE